MNAGADLAKVEYAAVNGMLSTLDPHSILMDPEQARDMDVSTSGKFGGLGIVIRMIDRKLTVVKPMKDTPAWRKGIKAGDHIVKINNEPTENLTSNEAVDRMRGDPKTGVTLWIERKGADRACCGSTSCATSIRVSQVEHKLLDKGVGYIKVKQFSKGIAADVAEAMKEMSAQGATSWILDLRGNPGGLLEEAVQLSDLFVDSGTIVTTVSGRDREARRAERGFGDTNVVARACSSTAARRRRRRSSPARSRTSTAPRSSARARSARARCRSSTTTRITRKLKLTIAQYLTPGDRSIQNLGIVPDIQLQRMYIPEKNDAPSDFVRMLAPTHTLRREGSRRAPRVDVREGQRQAGVRGAVPGRAQEEAGRRHGRRRRRRPTTRTARTTTRSSRTSRCGSRRSSCRACRVDTGPSSSPARSKLVATRARRRGEEARRRARRRSASTGRAPRRARPASANLDVSLATSPAGAASRPATSSPSPPR